MFHLGIVGHRYLSEGKTVEFVSQECRAILMRTLADHNDVVDLSAIAEGADLYKLKHQIARFGGSANGMPPIWVWECSDGVLLISNGVTRATRIHYLAPGQLVTIEITEVKPKAKFSRLLRVRDVAPPK